MSMEARVLYLSSLLKLQQMSGGTDVTMAEHRCIST